MHDMCTGVCPRVTSQAFGRVERIPPPDAEVRNHNTSSVDVTRESRTQSYHNYWTHDSGCLLITSISIGNLPYNLNIISYHLTHSLQNSVIKTLFANAFRSLTRKGPHGCVETNHAISSCTSQDHIIFDRCTTRCDDRSYEHFAALVRRITMTITRTMKTQKNPGQKLYQFDVIVKIFGAKSCNCVYLSWRASITRVRAPHKITWTETSCSSAARLVVRQLRLGCIFISKSKYNRRFQVVFWKIVKFGPKHNL